MTSNVRSSKRYPESIAAFAWRVDSIVYRSPKGFARIAPILRSPPTS